MVIRKNCFGEALYWYQKKISSYDQQTWEKKVEERMLNGIHFDVARKVAKLKTELIDLDLIRGSAFTKTKPKQSWITSTYFGIVRVCFFPFYLKWWVEQSNRTACLGLFILYALQLSAMFVYFSCDQLNNSDKFQTIPLSELISPLVMFFILGSIHSQISAGNLMSHKSKHLNKINPNNSNSNNSNSSVKPTDEGQRKRSTSTTTNVNKEQSIRNKITATCESTNGVSMTKLSYLPKSINVSGLRKRKKNHGHHHTSRNGGVIRSGRSSDQLPGTGASAEDVSGDDYSPYSTFHGQLNGRLDRLLNVEKSSENVKTGVHGCDLNDELDTRSTRSKTSIKTTKSTNSSTSNSLSNFSTDASLTKTRRTKETQCSPTQLIKTMKNQSTICELSSSESDRGMPPSPIKVLNDWPIINSDCSSDDEDDEEEEEEEVYCEDDETLILQLEEQEKLINEHIPSKVNGKFECDLSSNVRQQVNGHQRKSSGNCSKNDHEFTKMNGFKDDSQLPAAVARIDQSDQISCSIHQFSEWRKLEMSVLDISSMVIRKVATNTHSNEYFYLGVCCSLLLAIMPQIFRLQQHCPSLNLYLTSSTLGFNNATANEAIFSKESPPIVPQLPLQQQGAMAAAPTCGSISASNSTKELIEFLHYLPVIVTDLIKDIFSNPSYTWQMQYVVIVACLQRFFLSLLFFFFLCVAERTFRERLLCAKYFSHLTSARRAKKAELPHFRLNKVRNIKCWLSVRSYLKRHGPQRSVDCIVSTSFILAVTILTFLCIQLLKEAEICTGKLYCYEMVFWNMAIGVYIMRLIILGSKINRKYRSNMSVLLTEQVNLYLKLEQKPHKKEELTLANNVLKLACDLIKELEVPFKISGFSANPYLYNITKVIVLSAFSSLLSEILGFKLKLTKIKLSG